MKSTSTTRTALVTGAAGSIGRAIALELAGRGLDIIALDVSESVHETAAAVSSLGRDSAAVTGDLSTHEGVKAAFASVVEESGTIDVLVNSHGMVVSQPSTSHALDTWDRVLAVNLTSVFHLCQLVAPGMIERGSGRIVNVASLYSFFGGLRVPSYTASKGGVAQLTRALANEWAIEGVNVNAVAPGFIRTNLNTHVWQDEERSAEVISRTPAGRWGLPEDVAKVVSFLVSDDATFLHGAIIPVDGGYLGR